MDAKEYDAVVVPGGFGVAKNFCDFAVKGPDCTVDPKVEKVLKQFHELKKPIGLCCIAPVLAAKLFGSKGVEITLGKEGDEWPHSGTISTLLHKPIEACESLGSKVKPLDVREHHVDTKNKIYSTPW